MVNPFIVLEPYVTLLSLPKRKIEEEAMDQGIPALEEQMFFQFLSMAFLFVHLLQWIVFTYLASFQSQIHQSITYSESIWLCT